MSYKLEMDKSFNEALEDTGYIICGDEICYTYAKGEKSCAKASGIVCDYCGRELDRCDEYYVLFESVICTDCTDKEAYLND